MAEVEPTTLEPGGTNAVGRMLGLLGDEWTLSMPDRLRPLVAARRRA